MTSQLPEMHCGNHGNDGQEIRKGNHGNGVNDGMKVTMQEAWKE